MGAEVVEVVGVDGGPTLWLRRADNLPLCCFNHRTFQLWEQLPSPWRCITATRWRWLVSVTTWTHLTLPCTTTRRSRCRPSKRWVLHEERKGWALAGEWEAAQFTSGPSVSSHSEMSGVFKNKLVIKKNKLTLCFWEHVERVEFRLAIAAAVVSSRAAHRSLLRHFRS